MQFYLFSTVIPLIIVAIYLWRFRPNVLQALWETLPPLLGYILIIYVLEKEDVFDLVWVLYTLILFGFVYFVIVIAIRLITWVRKGGEKRKPLLSRPFKIGLIVVSIISVLVLIFYLVLGLFLGQALAEAAEGLAKAKKQWQEQSLQNRSSSDAVEMVTYVLTKESATDSYVYPVGLKVTYPGILNRSEVEGEDIKTVWLVLHNDSTNIWISALTDTNFNIPADKYLELESEKVLEDNVGAQVKGYSEYKANKHKINCVHIDVQGVTQTIGVISFKDYQLQVRIEDTTCNDCSLLSLGIEEILKSIELY